MKNTKGITLIALVVTIIILIILAGVSIHLVLGENGIVTKSQEAKKDYTNATIQEEMQLAEFANIIENRVIGDTEIQIYPFTNNEKLNYWLSTLRRRTLYVGKDIRRWKNNK